MNRRSLARKQSKLLKAIFESKPSTPQSTSGILKHIRHYTDNDVCPFGSGALKLKRFAGSVNIDELHPDLFAVYDGELVSEAPGSFSRVAVDALQIGSFAVRSGCCEEVVKPLCALFSNHPIARQLDRELFERSFIRFLLTRDQRDEYRSARKVHTVSLAHLYKGGAAIWVNAPESFDGYYRFDNPFQADITEAESRLEHFRSLNLPSMAKEIEQSIERMKTMAKENRYFGFHKIDLTTACITLGKLHGYRFFDGGPASANGWGNLVNCRESRYAYATIDTFDNYKYFAYDQGIYDVRVEYWPRLYSHLELADVTPPRIKMLIEFLEIYPEANHQALFDHYHILVPGLNYPYPIYGMTMKLRKVNGEVVEFIDEKPEEAHLVFDRELIENKSVLPILLGERDGSYYFISYFM